MNIQESQELQEILNDFFLEAAELLEKIDQDLLSLEKVPDQPELINRIFRSFHTLKGMSSFLGFENLTKITHHAEEVLNKLRKGEWKASTPIIDTLLKTSDAINELISYIKTNQSEEKRDISDIINKLIVLTPIGDEQPSVKQTNPNLAPPKEVVSHKKIGELLIEDKLASPEQVEKALSKQAEDFKLGEILLQEGVINEEQLNHTLRKQDQHPANQTIRVEVGRLDALMNLVGELVLSRNRLLRLHAEVAPKYASDFSCEDLSETIGRLNQITTDLQSAIMKTRLIPISRLFNKCPRMVRDLSHQAYKEINLVIAGEDTELDKSVIEEIHDPLIHLLRNCVDHGLETPEERIKKGKPLQGTIRLNSFYEGNQVVVEIEDDGRGINTSLLKNKAMEKGMISQAEAAVMSQAEALQLVFLPGLSTVDSITKLSGRGVGMDVVRSNIQRLKGLVSLESKVGEGTKIFLKIPLTLAIIQVLIVEVKTEIYALPLTFVHEVIRTSSVHIRTIEQQDIIQFRGEIFPLTRLSDLFEVVDAGVEDNGKYIVIVGVGEKKLALMIRSVIGQEELVIKSTCSYAETNYIGGASIMGDGRVVFIIDVPSLLNLPLKNKSDHLDTDYQKHDHQEQMALINQ